MTAHDDAAGWQEHDDGRTRLLLVARADERLAARLGELATPGANLIVYAWAPGQVAALAPALDLDLRPVRDTLLRHFRP